MANYYCETTSPNQEKIGAEIVTINLKESEAIGGFKEHLSEKYPNLDQSNLEIRCVLKPVNIS